jgi:alpha-L-rhamnosidase
LAGIEPDKNNPGYRTVTIRPIVPQNLTYAKASIMSPYGKIESGWRKENGKVIYDFTIPTSSKANIYLPATSLLQVEAGKYTFTVEVQK